jgi:hypothetical protein
MACHCMNIISKPLFATLLAIHIYRHNALYLLCYLISRSTDTTNIFIYYIWDRLASGTGREKLLTAHFRRIHINTLYGEWCSRCYIFIPLFPIYREHDTPFLILMASRVFLILSGLGRFLVILIGDGQCWELYGLPLFFLAYPFLLADPLLSISHCFLHTGRACINLMRWWEDHAMDGVFCILLLR